jgi:hypothetical protein
MTSREPEHRITQLLGRAGASAAARPDLAVCIELIAMICSLAPSAALRRETWEDSDGMSVCLGSDFGVVLGLDFPAGESEGPSSGWIRSQRSTGAVHWQLARRQAGWLWQLLTARERAGWSPSEAPATVW